jgi:hypothetical protein
VAPGQFAQQVKRPELAPVGGQGNHTETTRSRMSF